MTAGRERPAPASQLAAGATVSRSRLGAEVAVDPAVLDRLAGVCAVVDTSEPARLAAGRDWWPISAVWAEEALVPAVPAAVAAPTSSAEVAGVLAVCNQAGVPVTPAAGRSGVCGGAVPAFGGVVLDLTGLAGVEAVDERSLLVDVRPGTWGDAFEAELRRAGLTLGHWPQSVAISTVGGWIACRGAGQYSTRYGKIEDMVAGLEVVLADGRVVRTGAGAPRAAVGPDLTQLFVGSEGTLGVVTAARLRVRPLPPAERRAAWSFPDLPAGIDACRRVLRRGATPAVLRLYDRTESARQWEGSGGCVLVVLDEGDEALVDATMAVTADECAAAGADRLDDAVVGRWLEHRNEVPALGPLVAAGIVADTVEVAGSWAALPGIYADAVEAVAALPDTLVVSAHQSHAYPDGACLYFTFAGRPALGGPGGAGATKPAEAYYLAAWDAIMAATRRHGGAISHHHGVGLNRGRYLEGALGSAFPLLQRVKDALDPEGILNPGKLGLRSPFGPPPWP